MNSQDKIKWNQRYRSSDTATPAAAEILLDNQHLLPASGQALDLACGRGGNALLLATHGLETNAWDISDVVIEQLNDYALEQHLEIKAICRDAVKQPPETNSFDVIVVSRFLERTLFPTLKQAVKPGGLVFYQTFIKDKVSDGGPNNPEYRLAENELLSCFEDWIIRIYREEGSIGDPDRGFRNQAAIVAQKPK